MTKILIGLVLIMLELTLTVKDIYIIGLLPDFLGYLLLVFGMKEVSNQTDYYQSNRKFTFWIGAFSLMVYVMNLLGLSARGSFEALLMQLLIVVLEPICLYRLVKGIRQMEKDYELALGGKLLFVVWLLMTIVSPLAFVLGIFSELAGILGFIQTTVSIIFIGLFIRTTYVYNAACVEVEYEEEES